jgi:hypothetical protein
MMLSRTISIVFLAALCALVACAPITVEEGTPVLEETQVPTTEVPTVEAPTETPSVVETPENGGQLPMSEVPEALFDVVLADLLERTGSDRSMVEVIKSEFVVWSDGSLGCPQPGMMYTQALVDGYQVIFAVDGNTFDYHLSDRGAFVLCESGPEALFPSTVTPTE